MCFAISWEENINWDHCVATWNHRIVLTHDKMIKKLVLYENVCYHTHTEHIQSGTKPNLVAKIWPPNLVTICAWLPKLVANVSSNFHHLVNTGLAVGSFFKWLPITVAHTCKLDTIWVVYISPIGNGSIRLYSPWTHYSLWNFTSSGAGRFSELAGAHT